LTLASLQAFGLSVETPAGWDGEIYRRDDGGLDLQAAGAEHVVEHRPVVHLSTVPLPAVRGDFGGGVVSQLGSQDIFVTLFEYEPEAASTELFATQGVPWPLALEDFDANTLRMPLPGQVGCQRFFTVNGRPFMLYVVLGSNAMRRLLVPTLNRALAGVALG
jgi:hypothetical protein